MVGTTCLKHITLIPKQNCMWRLFSVSIAWSSLVISSILTVCSTVTGKSSLVNSSNLRFPPDTKHLGKVSLSPQRRSFGSGCSWKEMSLGNSSNSAQTSSSSPANQSNFLSEERDELFFEMEGPTSPRSLPQTPSPRPPSFSPFQGHPPPSPLLPPPPPLHLHTPRVIDHVPLRDRERERKNWRQREPNWWQGGHKHLGGEGEDDEPEWMAFGPSDRNEVIELKGLEEHEREREGLYMNPMWPYQFAIPWNEPWWPREVMLNSSCFLSCIVHSSQAD